MADRTLSWLLAESAARLAWMDAGPGNAYLLAYGTAKPTTPGDPAGGSALLRVDLQKPSGLVQADGSLNLVMSASSYAGLVAGTVAWARLFNGNDVAGLDMAATNLAGAGEFRLSNLSIIVGSSVRVLLSTMK